MLLRSIYDEKLAQASYLLGCQRTGEALVVDPNRDVEQYIKAARKEGLRITHVTETHIHADFASGTRELAHKTGAKMYLSGEGGPDWTYQFATAENAVIVHDGDEFKVGNLRVQVMHTPGHTPEHICFIVTDLPVTDQPMGIFTGDFVFVGDVGRPDLLEKAAGVSGSMRDGARALYKSITRFREMKDYLQVWPGHGAGSACGKALGAIPQSTVGYEKMFSPAFRFDNEDDFVDFILAGQPEPPKYFAEMKRMNREGPPLIGEIRAPARLDASKLAELLQNGTTIVDTRTSLAFGRGHVPGTINIPYNKAFTTWTGWLLSYHEPFAVIADEKSIAELTRDLVLIGLDNIAGYFTADVLEGSSAETTPAITTADMEPMLEQNDAFVLDVRGRAEWEAGHLPGVPNIPVGYLGDRSSEIPRDKRIVVYCQGGSRSSIAASVLQSLGFDAVNVRGGFDEWAASNRPVETGATVAAD